jgi:hypothetical protein
VYTGRKEPNLLPNEAAEVGQAGMMLAIRVEPKARGDKMHLASRIDYSRLYTVEHYVKVKEFGDVHRNSLTTLRNQWWFVFQRDMSGVVDTSMHQAHAGQGQQVNATLQVSTASAYQGWVTAHTPFNDPNMLELRAGDRIGVTAIVDEHWWTGMNTRTNERGLFPASYVTTET